MRVPLPLLVDRCHLIVALVQMTAAATGVYSGVCQCQRLGAVLCVLVLHLVIAGCLILSVPDLRDFGELWYVCNIRTRDSGSYKGKISVALMVSALLLYLRASLCDPGFLRPDYRPLPSDFEGSDGVDLEMGAMVNEESVYAGWGRAVVSFVVRDLSIAAAGLVMATRCGMGLLSTGRCGRLSMHF